MYQGSRQDLIFSTTIAVRNYCVLPRNLERTLVLGVGKGGGLLLLSPHSTQRWSLRSEVTQKTKVQGLTTETGEAKCCHHLVLMASADYRHSHSDLKPWPQDGKTLHGLQLLPYTYQCSIHTEVDSMQFD